MPSVLGITMGRLHHDVASVKRYSGLPVPVYVLLFIVVVVVTGTGTVSRYWVREIRVAERAWY